jgi:hypothetical protein
MLDALRERQEKLRQAIDHVAHFLPKQGPIGVFVHHNTLHAFEELPFEQAVIEAWGFSAPHRTVAKRRTEPNCRMAAFTWKILMLCWTASPTPSSSLG